MILHIFHVG